MKFSIFDSVSKLPLLNNTEGDEAYVRENNTFYSFNDLSLSTTYSYEFPGGSSYLSFPTILQEFPNSNSTFTIDFWSFPSTAGKKPIFTIETPTITYDFQDDLNHTLDILGDPKSFYISPYDSESITSEYLNGSTDRFRSYDIQNDLFDVGDKFNIEYFTRASTSSFSIFSSYKTNKAEPILVINNNGIITNGVTLSSSMNYVIDDWQHNRLLYDGFDYSLYKNGEFIPLTYPTNSVFDSNDNILLGDINVLYDTGFECKVTFPSNPSNGVLFELGGTKNRMRVELINNGNTLYFTAGDTSQNLSVSITDFPKDNQSHIVKWDVQINPARIRLWIDGVLKGQNTKSVPIVDNIWASYDNFSELSNITGFQTYNWYTSLLILNGGKQYSTTTPWAYSRLSPTGHNINVNGDKIHYFEIKFVNRNAYGRRLNFFIYDPNRFNDYYWWARAYWRYDFSSPTFIISTYWGYKDNVISVFINENERKVYFFNVRPGGQKTYLGSLSYNHFPNYNITSARYLIEGERLEADIIVSHGREYWEYDPTQFDLSILGIPAQGAYGSNYDQGVRNNPWPGELVSDLRTYPQCISSLSEGSFNIGNRYIPSTNNNSSYYKGYINNFYISSDSALVFNEDSNLTDSDFTNGFLKTLLIPEQSLSVNPNSKFLLSSEATGGQILSYETDGSIKINGKPVQAGTDQSTLTWRHNSISYDGTFLRYFQDGILQFKDSVDFSPLSLSNGVLNLGRGTDVNYNNASYFNYYLTGNISDFRIRKEALQDSNFAFPVEPYGEDSSVLLTANKSAVEVDPSIINYRTVRSMDFSPYSSLTKSWYKTGVLTDKVINTSYSNNHFTFDMRDSSITFDNCSPSIILEFRKKDYNNQDLEWRADYIQASPEKVSVKKIDNRFLIEPIFTNDSYSSRDVIISFIGNRVDSNIPVVSTSESELQISDLTIDFDYTDFSVHLADRNNFFALPYFDIRLKDSSDDSDFTNISPISYRLYSDIIPLEILDSIGELP